MSNRSPWLKRLLSPVIRKGKAFARDDDATTAIEFALLGMPFFTIIFAIIETAMMFFAAQVLDSAVQDASRLIRTGQAQIANYTIADFKSAICSRLYNLFNCANLKVEVTPVSSFSTATAVWPVQTNCTTTCNWTIPEDYDDGVGKQIMMVQAFYKWPLLINFPWFNLKNQPDNYRLISGIRVFRNEPF